MSGAPILFDRSLLAAHRSRARRMATPGADFLLARASEDLIDRLATVKRHFGQAAIIDALTPDLAARLIASGQVGTIVRPDTDDGLAAEVLDLAPASIDLAVSALALQWVNDLPGLMVQIRRALKPDGLLLAIVVGGDTLTELRTVLTTAESEIRGGAAPRVAPFADIRDMGGLLQRAGFALPVIDTDRLIVRYDTIFHLMRDLRAMGATSALAARDPRPLTRAILARAAALYAERYADPDGRIRATFELISISGWAPHESQPKPLKPGSATMRLEDALKAVKGSNEPK
ncbi:methyltransferase domain-containing protein [Kaistia dalseonensis]|uniref:SAM-dependent methyltransferase n=1 Tax=Kaistia dalseonensis TaxID=410840 RepID=A0ABU0H3L2_9HYPH|nr:methyltransferase domain-containing protein [Kaistia dalseonensis]MCX5494294.1 methyltransferase domain-containing protein [Kaistia dalseonensis]MDQ0436875.1 SAM-dependent methyltransferase [Kaistia dalseonensis]